MTVLITVLITGGLVVLAAVALAWAGWAANRPEPGHGHPSWSQRAGKHIREATSAARAWWATRRPLAPEDRMTVAWLEVVHDDPGDTDPPQAARAAELYHEEMGLGAGFFPDALPAPVDVPGRETGSAPRPAPAPAGDFIPAPPDMGPVAGTPIPVTTATCAGAPTTPKVDSPAPAEPRTAGVEPGPESEPSGAPVPAPAGRQWAIDELTGHHLPADTSAFPKVTGVA